MFGMNLKVAKHKLVAALLYVAFRIEMAKTIGEAEEHLSKFYDRNHVLMSDLARNKNENLIDSSNNKTSLFEIIKSVYYLGTEEITEDMPKKLIKHALTVDQDEVKRIADLYIWKNKPSKNEGTAPVGTTKTTKSEKKNRPTFK